jgi:nicotinamidase-related amidase
MTNEIQTIVPGKTVLLVMDYQIAILKRLNNSDELLLRMSRVIDMVRDMGIQVGFVRVAFEDEDYDAIPKTNKSFNNLATERRLHNRNPDSAIHNAVAPKTGDIIVRKTRVGAFSTTDLNHQLKKMGIDTLILAGISTSGVVLSTIRAAADLDYRIFVLADCCMDMDMQVHDILISKVFPRQAEIIYSDVFIHPESESERDKNE